MKQFWRGNIPSIASLLIYVALGFIILRQYNESLEIEDFATQMKAQLAEDKLKMKEMLYNKVYLNVKGNLTSKVRKLIMDEISGKIRKHVVDKHSKELQIYMLNLLKPTMVEDSKVILRKDVEELMRSKLESIKL